MEGIPTYSLITLKSEIDDRLLFSLAPAPHRWPQLMVIGGSPGMLTGLNYILTLMSELGLKHDLFVPAVTQKAVPWLQAHSLPEPGKLESGAPLQRSLTECQAIIAGIGLHISSAAQIELEKILLSLDQPTLVTDELLPLYKTNPQLLDIKHLIPFLSLQQLIKLLGISRTGVKLAPDRGIFNVGTILSALPVAAPFVTTYDSERLYTYIPSTQQVIHTPIPDGMNVDEMRANFAAALAVTVWTDRGAHELTDLIETAHYIFAHMLNGQSPAEAAKMIRSVLEPSF